MTRPQGFVVQAQVNKKVKGQNKPVRKMARSKGSDTSNGRQKMAKDERLANGMVIRGKGATGMTRYLSNDENQ